jgi:single-strand DNA-binding protein
MASFNHVSLSGFLGKDPEIKYFEGGGCAVELRVAVEVYAGKGDEGKPKTKTLWMTCKAFNKRAEFIAEHYTKGEKVYIQGNLDFWKYGKEGEEHTVTFVVIDEIDKHWAKKQAEG